MICINANIRVPDAHLCKGGWISNNKIAATLYADMLFNQIYYYLE